jgi:hypothetical protein
MNEKIKEFAKQANLNEDAVPYHLSDYDYLEYPNVEKFAELVIKECIDYCGENLSKTVGGALKIHFGVKE